MHKNYAYGQKGSSYSSRFGEIRICVGQIVFEIYRSKQMSFSPARNGTGALVVLFAEDGWSTSDRLGECVLYSKWIVTPGK